LEREGYRLVRTRISTDAPTATAYFSMVVNVGRVHTPLSRRETALFVVHILTADFLLCHSGARARGYEIGHEYLQCTIRLERMRAPLFVPAFFW
jgi:hypothetical protein